MVSRVRKFWLRFTRFVRVQIWEQDLTRLPWLHAFSIRQLRVLALMADANVVGRITLRASAMTLTTLLSLVPLLVLLFSLIRALGGFSDLELRLEQLVLDNFVPGTQDQVRSWLRRLLESEESGAFSGISALILLGGVLGLLASIESSFNAIWGVSQGRKLLQRFKNYTTIIFIAPILIGLSLTMTASLESPALWTPIVDFAPALSGLLGWAFKFLPILFTGIALTLLYTILPNVRVPLRASLPAGIVAAVLWELSKVGYAGYLRNAAHYDIFYGSLAAIPFFIIWIHLSWLVVLFGAQLAFAQQAADDIREEETALQASGLERIRVAFYLSMAAARNYQEGKPPPESVELAHQLGLPLRLVRETAEVLAGGCILHAVVAVEGEEGLVPARPPQQITVYEVLRCLLERGQALSHRAPVESRELGADQVLRDLERSIEERWAKVSLADLLEKESSSSSQEVLPIQSLPPRTRGKKPGSR